MTPAEILTKLKEILGGNAEETLAAAQDLEARAQVAGLATKALDEGEWSTHQAKVKELETKLTEATALVVAQKAEISALDSRLKAMETAQAAYQSRGEKAINEVKGLLVTLNTKPELTAPAEQAKLAALEDATKAKIEAAEGAGKSSGTLTIKRFDYGPNGQVTVKPI